MVHRLLHAALVAAVALAAFAFPTLALPTAAGARTLGLELASTTRWQVTQSADRLGQDGTAGFTLIGGVGLAPTLRLEAIWRVFSESGYGPADTSSETLEHQVGLGLAQRVLDRNYWSVEACGALGASWRRLELSDWSVSSGDADWRGWSPFVEAGAAIEVGLPRTMTRDRYALGLRLQLGWQHVFGRGVSLTSRAKVPADTVAAPIELGNWSISGPMTRFGVFARF